MRTASREFQMSEGSREPEGILRFFLICERFQFPGHRQCYSVAMLQKLVTTTKKILTKFLHMLELKQIL